MPDVVNNLLTISMITKEALRVLENNLVVATKVNREYDDKFAVDGAKIGNVVNARKPPRYLGRRGQALSIEASTETSVPVALQYQDGCDIQFSSADLALSIDEFSDRFIKPAVATVANKIDAQVATLYSSIWNGQGTPGTTPNALLTYLLAGVDLDNNLAPQDGQRYLCLTPIMQAYIIDALKGLFQQANAISEQYMKGEMGTAIGFEWYMDQNLPTAVIGPQGGTPVVNGANQTGSSLITNGWTAAAASRLVVGDRFTLPGVFLVNAQSRLSTGILQSFVVTAPAASDGAGNLTLQIAPPIITGGAFQTVSASPANAAALTIVGAANVNSPQGLAFHRDALTLATADLPLPRGVDMAARISDKQLGISIRMVRAYDINSDNFPCRLDVLYGVAALRPELASRIAA